MKNFNDREGFCSSNFANLGKCYHLWTPEDFEIIFSCDSDYMTGMGITGICAKLFSDVRILTFELMSNHLHITAAGNLDRMYGMFSLARKMLMRNALSSGKTVNWERFTISSRELENLEDLRNVIVYDNRNGYVVNPEHTPFSYPWGANRYYFNKDACRLAESNASELTVREIRSLTHSRIADGIRGLGKFDGYVLPVSFCDIPAGESVFRDASHYFYKLSRSIESNKTIAKEIGESVFYTDNELFATISQISKKVYSEPIPSSLAPSAKIEFAKRMRFEYNASAKQINRLLKIGSSVLESLGIV